MLDYDAWLVMALRETWDSVSYLCETAAWHGVAPLPCKDFWPRMGRRT